MADWPPSAIQKPGMMVSRYGPQTPGTKTGFGDMARWQVDVPATAARRLKAWDLSFLAASELSWSDPSWTFAPTVPIQPA